MAEEQAMWYVVHTYSGYEKKVAQDLEKMVENRHLQDLICEVKVPVEMVLETKKVKPKKSSRKSSASAEDEESLVEERLVEHKLFPGYVMVKMVMTDDTWYVVRNTRGVTGFVGAASNAKPLPLSQQEVADLGIESAPAITTDRTVDYKVGDTVQIASGPLEGFSGLVEKIDLTAGKVQVKVSMFGRETPAELELDQVKPL